MLLGTRCNAKVGGRWEEISIEEAIAGIGTDYRCLRYKRERVRAYSKGKDGRAAHFQHLKANEKCDLGHGLCK
jgi:hypothetical protein